MPVFGDDPQGGRMWVWFSTDRFNDTETWQTNGEITLILRVLRFRVCGYNTPKYAHFCGRHLVRRSAPGSAIATDFPGCRRSRSTTAALHSSEIDGNSAASS